MQTAVTLDPDGVAALRRVLQGRPPAEVGAAGPRPGLAHDAAAGRIGTVFLYAPTYLGFGMVLLANLVGWWWWLWLEGFVPPPVGAFAGGPGARCDSGWGMVRRTRQRS